MKIKDGNVEIVPAGKQPTGWASAKISEMIGKHGVFVDGDWVESKDQDPDGDVRLVQLADIGDGFYRNRSRRFLRMKKAEEIGCTFLKKGDVLVARMPDPLGRACLFPGDDKPSVTAVDVCVVRCGQESIVHSWLMYVVNSPQVRSAIASLESGTTRKRISRKNLAKLEFPIPPLSEQQRIVAKVEELFIKLDAGVEALKKVKAQLKRYRQAVLKCAFEAKLTEEWRKSHQDEIEPASILLGSINEERKQKLGEKYKELPQGDASNLRELPDSWQWTSVGKLVDDALIGLVKSRREQNADKRGAPYIKMNNVTMDGTVLLDDLVYVTVTSSEAQRYAIKEGDILFNTRNSVELVGKTGIVRGSVDGMVYNNNLMRIRMANRVSSAFVVHQMSSLGFRQRMEMVKRATTNVAALYAKDLMPLPFALAPVAEQHRIVEEIERCLSIAEDVEKTVDRNLEQVEKLRQSILKNAFQGKLVPQDPSDEPADKLLARMRAEKAKTEEEKAHKKRENK